MLTVRDRMRGGIWALITGDALGVPVEFYYRSTLERKPVTGMREHGTHNQPRGTWSDDSSMMLGAMDSLTSGYDPDGMMRNFAKWLYDNEFTPWGKVFDVGRTCKKSIRFWQTYDYDALDAGVKDERSNGNGSLMWVLPVCYYGFSQEKKQKMNVQQAAEMVMKTSGITHAHKVSETGCGLYYFMLREMLGDEKKADLNTTLVQGLKSGFTYYEDLGGEWQAAADRYRRLSFGEAFADFPEQEIVSHGYVVSTLEAAVWCLLTTDNLKDALLKAVNLGDDTDTVAAVTGGLGGTWYGYDAIPEEWLDTLARRNWIKELSEKFLASLEV